MLHAAVTSFQAFFALRFLLGMCECCVAPILILLISMFYKKDEQVSTSILMKSKGLRSYSGSTGIMVLCYGMS